MPPFSIGYCKGWKRAVVALITLQGIRELNLETEISHRIKVSCRLTYRIYSAGTRFIAFLFLLVLLTFTSISMIAYSLLVPDLQQLFLVRVSGFLWHGARVLQQIQGCAWASLRQPRHGVMAFKLQRWSPKCNHVSISNLVDRCWPRGHPDKSSPECIPFSEAGHYSTAGRWRFCREAVQ